MAYLTTYGGVDTSAAHEHYQSFHQTTVKTITLDKAAEQYGKPQFIKIDAEGAEGPILEGNSKPHSFGKTKTSHRGSRHSGNHALRRSPA